CHRFVLTNCLLHRPRPSLFPSTTLFRSIKWAAQREDQMPVGMPTADQERELACWLQRRAGRQFLVRRYYDEGTPDPAVRFIARTDRKSTRLNSSHVKISYAVFCLKKIKR